MRKETAWIGLRLSANWYQVHLHPVGGKDQALERWSSMRALSACNVPCPFAVGANETVAARADTGGGEEVEMIGFLVFRAILSLFLSHHRVERIASSLSPHQHHAPNSVHASGSLPPPGSAGAWMWLRSRGSKASWPRSMGGLGTGPHGDDPVVASPWCS